MDCMFDCGCGCACQGDKRYTIVPGSVRVRVCV